MTDDIKGLCERLEHGRCPENTGCGVMKTCLCALADDMADRLESLAARADAAERHAADLAVALSEVMRQAENDLEAAHEEICKLQGLDPKTHTWPEWSAPANTLRWFDDLRRTVLDAYRSGAPAEQDEGGERCNEHS